MEFEALRAGWTSLAVFAPGTAPRSCNVPRRRRVARREHGLLVDERVALVARTFERAVMPLEHDE